MGFGVCRLSIVPVRGEAADSSEMVTQLLFGDHYTVLEEHEGRKWLKIEIYFDKYIGWIDAKQHHAISEAYFNQINNSDYKVCTEVMSSILFHKNHINIVIGSVLPISTNELFKMEEQLAFNGESKSLSLRRDVEFIKIMANKYLSSPYLWGGRSPFGIDCSGFSQNVFRLAGYSLPRDSSIQAKEGEEVIFGDHQSGDLAFFSNDKGKVTHVGILLSRTEIIHASGKVRKDSFDEKGILIEENNQYSHNLYSIRRIVKH